MIAWICKQGRAALMHIQITSCRVSHKTYQSLHSGVWWRNKTPSPARTGMFASGDGRMPATRSEANIATPPIAFVYCSVFLGEFDILVLLDLREHFRETWQRIRAGRHSIISRRLRRAHPHGLSGRNRLARHKCHGRIRLCIQRPARARRKKQDTNSAMAAVFQLVATFNMAVPS